MSEPCTSASNCLVVIHTDGGVDLHSSRRPTRWLTVDTDEWEAHLAEVRAAALTEAAEVLDAITLPMKQLPNKLQGEDVRARLGGLEEALAVIGALIAVRPETAPTSTLPADDAPPVPEQAPGPHRPAEGFYDDDEPVAEVIAAFQAGEKRTITPPGSSGQTVHLEAQRPAEGSSIRVVEWGLDLETPYSPYTGPPVLIGDVVTPPDDLNAIGVRNAIALRAADCIGEAYTVPWDEIRESLADVAPLAARLDALRAQRDDLAFMLKERNVDLDAARAAAETFRDELNRTGEQLLAVRADREEYRKSVLSYADDLIAVRAERDRLADALRGADPWADTGGARLAEYLALHWPARVGAALKADQSAADLAIEVLKHLCGQLAKCHTDLARMQPVIDAATVWRDAGWNTHTEGPATDLAAAVDAYTTEPDGGTS